MEDEVKPCPVCDGPECPWWDFMAWDCCQITKAHLTEPPKLKAEVLETLAKSKSQALANLQKKGLPGAADTEQAKGGNQGLPDTDSTSDDTKD